MQDITLQNRKSRATHPSTMWRIAYRAALVNAGLFFCLSGLMLAVRSTSVAVNGIVALVFFVGSLRGAYLLARAGGGLAALTFFVMGTGMFFGLGTWLSTLSVNGVESVTFNISQQQQMLAVVNMLNSSSVFIVLLVSWPLCHQGAGNGMKLSRIVQIISQLSPLRGPLIYFGFLLLILQIVTFPIPTNLILRNILSNAVTLEYLGILLAGMAWSKLTSLGRLAPAILVVMSSGIGLLSLSKEDMLKPLVAFCIGLAFDRRSRKTLIVIGACALVGYFTIFAAVCNLGRNSPLYSDGQNSISESVQIVEGTWDAIVAGSAGTSVGNDQGYALLRRFVAAPVQAFLIERYDQGAPGDSLSGIGEALIPRVLWPGKPIITRFGPELDKLFYSRSLSASSLAPSYSAEAYWNYGWVGLILVSILVGLEIGWFTHKWNMFARYGLRQVGVLIFAVPIVRYAAWVENWTVTTYIGGFVTYVLLIKLADIVTPIFLTAISKPTHRTIIGRMSAPRGDRQGI